MWYNGSTSTFAIGGGGSFVANKKLHINGATSIGSSLALTAVATNGLLVQTQVSAPIFYDSDNTGYYVDAASNSALYQITTGVGINLNGGIALNGSGATLANSIGARLTESYGPLWNCDNSSTWHHQVINGSMLCGFTAGGTNWGSGKVVANSDMRATLFYDYSNTAYYVDPASGSVLGGNVSILGGRNITFDTSGGSITIKGDSGGWGTGLYFLGSAGTNRGGFGALGGGDGLSYLWAGNAYNNAALYLYASNYAESPGSFRAPIFYDSNNTNYYCDPASTSVLNVVAGYSLRNIEDVSIDTPYGIYFSSNFNTDYAIYREAGAWSSPYPDLRIAFYTGIKMGAEATYGGMRFYNTSSMATQVMSINNSADGLGTGNVYVNNSLQAGSSLRAPIFYDTTNTAYYWNFADGSQSNIYTYIAGLAYYQCQYGSGAYSGAVTSPPLQVFSSDGGTAMMSFHRSGAYAINMGLDPDNFLRIGGWSAAANRWVLDGSGNNWVAGSFRAPIFYDSNNTSFYVDPQGGSAFQGALIIGPNTSGKYTRFGGNGGATDMCTVSASNGNLHLDAETGSNIYLAWYNTSTVNVGGSVVANGNITAYSDIRVKDNVETIPSALDKLDQIRGVTYTRTDLEDKERRYAGVIAQEIEQVLPEAVFENEEYKSVDYNATIGLLIQAVKELTDKVKALEAKE